MNPALRAAVLASLEALPSKCEITHCSPIDGGCINHTYVVSLSSGDRVFVKTNDSVPQDFFECEAVGLRRLAATGTVRIPDVLGLGRHGDDSFLVLEYIQPGRQGADFFELLGRSLALTHRGATATQFGLEFDNYLGHTRQVNRQMTDWVTFWSQCRLEFQLKLAVDRGLDSRELLVLGKRLLSRLEGLIGVPVEPPTLLHGDLWSGNFHCDLSGSPVLLDPAVYFGHREAEFGMTTLFGGFDDSFYSAYNEVWPLVDGHEQRIEIYRLYHLLNHLNLFGVSYLTGCLEILRKYE